MDVLLISVVVVALAFDFTNGFHDTANAIATSVSTRAVSPKLAVFGASVLNFAGAFVSLKVAATVAKGIVAPGAITLHVVLAGILAATLWNLITWRCGLPTSSSHALIGGVVGSAAVASGWKVVKWHGLTHSVVLPSLAAPVLGFASAGIVMLIIRGIIRNRSSDIVEPIFRRMQLISGGFVAFTHGTNDAQKTMGIIALALLAGHPEKSFHVPLWVISSSASAMALGTYIGGWRIINTLGNKLVKLNPSEGFAAETATASILGLTAHFGFPISTTHTVSGSIMGAGVASGLAKVRWKTSRDILIAWALTMPCAAAVGAGMEAITHLPAGSSLAITLATFVAAIILVTRHWTWETTAQLRARLNFIQQALKTNIK
ncbi:MAG TPA: inorganic phosphate transporter [Candidatus Saccharimonadales bacterium]|jgi:PiT family inorganic phosphate transporter|nr:inorganic phosphate transporter [Candidatus Saccharimonadales bacterium]